MELSSIFNMAKFLGAYKTKRMMASMCIPLLTNVRGKN